MNDRDRSLLVDMLLEARRIGRFLADVDEAAFASDEKLEYAVARAIMILGEAASRVTPETRQAHPGIPWAAITGMRHRLVHDYRRIDLPRIWRTASEDVPLLIPPLEAALGPEEDL